MVLKWLLVQTKVHNVAIMFVCLFLYLLEFDTRESWLRKSTRIRVKRVARFHTSNFSRFVTTSAMLSLFVFCCSPPLQEKPHFLVVADGIVQLVVSFKFFRFKLLAAGEVKLTLVNKWKALKRWVNLRESLEVFFGIPWQSLISDLFTGRWRFEESPLSDPSEQEKTAIRKQWYSQLVTDTTWPVRNNFPWGKILIATLGG